MSSSEFPELFNIEEKVITMILQGSLSVIGEEKRVIFQAVKEMYDTELAEDWKDEEERKCRFVFIGKLIFFYIHFSHYFFSLFPLNLLKKNFLGGP